MIRKAHSIALSEEALKLVSAAFRHLRDAEHLVDDGHAHASPDQAYHLAGYAPECMRKATLGVRWFDKAIGHRFDGTEAVPMEFVVALDPMARRYDVSHLVVSGSALARWQEVSRYDASGTYPRKVAEACVHEARAVLDHGLFALWADGRIALESLA